MTKVLLGGTAIAGYYTLATGQVDFSDLPSETIRRLPRRQLPVAILAWLGVSAESQGGASAACSSREPPSIVSRPAGRSPSSP